MKNKDLKKGKESTIGKIIYGFLLFMPLLAIAVTCSYAIFNKNAYQSKADTTYTIEEKTTTQDFTTLIDNTDAFVTLIASNQYENLQIASYKVKFRNFTIQNTTYQSGIFTLGAAIGTRDGYFITFYDDNFIYINRYPINDNTGTYQFYLVEAFSDNSHYYPNNMYTNYFQYWTIQSSSYTLDNTFYYAIDKVERSNLFNWAENSLIYTGIANTCTQLSITNTFIPLLLAYWLIISVIYILYDIILMILIILHNKVHQIQDSI